MQQSSSIPLLDESGAPTQTGDAPDLPEPRLEPLSKGERTWIIGSIGAVLFLTTVAALIAFDV